MSTAKPQPYRTKGKYVVAMDNYLYQIPPLPIHVSPVIEITTSVLTELKLFEKISPLELVVQTGFTPDQFITKAREYLEERDQNSWRVYTNYS